MFDKGSFAAAYSGFEGTIGGADDGISLAQWLGRHGITSVDVCGVATDYCVRATAIDAAREGFDTRVLGALVAAVHPRETPRVVEELRHERVEWLG